MSFPTAAGHPDHSGSYIPTLYAMALLIAFYATTVFGEIANTEYESELQKHGDTMRIRVLPDITSREYVKGQDLQYESPEGSYIDLLVDKGRYWGLAFDDVDKVQTDIDYVNKWAEHAVMGHKIAIDAEILGDIYGDVHASNAGATAGAKSGDINLGASGAPLALDSDNIVETIVACGVVLDEQNVPDEDRWMILPSWAIGKLKTSDLFDASKTGDSVSPIRNGKVGKVDRFTIYRSNQLATATDGSYTATNCLFGHKSALAFVSQMTKTETLRNPKTFGDIMRSLQSYGYKVIKPEAMGLLYVRKAS